MSESEAEKKRLQAIEFMERVGNDPSKFEQMDAAAYAEHRGAELQNPSKGKTEMTKQELDELVDTLADGLEECLDPSLTREEVISKVQELSDLASGETPETEDDEE
jgi:hypothetical protein